MRREIARVALLDPKSKKAINSIQLIKALTPDPQFADGLVLKLSNAVHNNDRIKSFVQHHDSIKETI
jgi:hypothetical protein